MPSTVANPARTTHPSFPVLDARAAAHRLYQVRRALLDELLTDALDCHRHGAELLTPDDFAAMAREAAHYANQLLDHAHDERCDCGDRLEEPIERATGSCWGCYQDSAERFGASSVGEAVSR